MKSVRDDRLVNRASGADLVLLFYLTSHENGLVLRLSSNFVPFLVLLSASTFQPRVSCHLPFLPPFPEAVHKAAGKPFSLSRGFRPSLLLYLGNFVMSKSPEEEWIFLQVKRLVSWVGHFSGKSRCVLITRLKHPKSRGLFNFYGGHLEGEETTTIDVEKHTVGSVERCDPLFS